MTSHTRRQPASGSRATAGGCVRDRAPLEGTEAMHEVEHIDERVGHRHRPIDPGAAFLQRLEDHEICSKVHPIGGEPQGFG